MLARIHARAHDLASARLGRKRGQAACCICSLALTHVMPAMRMQGLAAMKRLLVWFVRQRKAANRLPALAFLNGLGGSPAVLAQKLLVRSGMRPGLGEKVVMFIKASRETHSGELVLIIRPNVYVSEDSTEEPDLMYIPETHQITSTMSGANTLQASMMLLQESLESGAAMAQFEQLYRKKHGLTMNAARLPANIPKNRYRDVSPYDQTRVILKGSQNGDYINANFVNMEIPGSGIINRYIAAQGPLPNTCADFWQMVWEQHCTLVVMLTTKVERGRVKCHQYWPDLYETTDFGTNQERHIKHMQYIAWPDHGVPDDPADFLDFVIRVRKNRIGMVEPTVVHCSAGIGRTGVLITMETAMCLVEANQTVFPLAIVRQMRDQRAMLIQTASQYKFVCEAILRVYHGR
ncbi:PTPN4 [Acanthosepion pharaonis]|uniref:PTPN4 n=1 Tax=Acanthosepion pharaonis TaxID=158019 RepID=A0A812DIS9_ACAPH|nr:PTPN4 [Sepia pharaonis]